MQKVAVIGAGAAGLCAARHLLTRRFVITVFESCDHVGGTWHYTDRTGTDARGNPIHSSMYRNLKTNLPKQVMAFPDFPFDEALRSFLTHGEVLQYLEAYCDRFEIRPHIRFNTKVEDVKLVPGSRDRWHVTSFDAERETRVSETYDAVMVCNGHYAAPHVPAVPGHFRGRTLHSHDYREPSALCGRDVVLFGARASATDIAVDLCGSARRVYLAHRGHPLKFKLPPNVEEKATVTGFDGDEVMFADGSCVHCDVFMFCTGYNYHFPFLEPDLLHTNSGERVTPLYKHLLHIEHPSLSVIGLGLQICPFPQFHCQVAYAVAALDGSMSLPGKDEMYRDEKADFEARVAAGLRVKSAHLLGGEQWAYNDMLADACGLQRVPDHVRLLYDLTHTRRLRSLLEYKNEEFVMDECGSRYRVVEQA